MNTALGDSSNVPREFTSTHWSLVARARSGDSGERHQALGQLLATYYGALRAHLVGHMRIDRHRAEDLLQSFVCRKILQRDLMQRADRGKGRLRSLLLKSLENFVRTEQARARRAGVQNLDLAATEPAVSEQGPDVFDVAWARSLLMEALARMRAQCHATRRPQIWKLLESRVVAPALTRAKPLSYDELVAQFGFGSPQEASNALITAKRQFKRTLREVIGESVQSDAEIDDELIELRAILATAKPDQSAVSLFEDVAEPDNLILTAIDETDPSAWARLIELRIDRDSLWDETDFGGYLRHQLATPLATAFHNLGDAPGLAMASITCFDDVLAQRTPHLGLLKAIKTTGRDLIARKAGGMPAQVAAVFYFGCIAMGMVRRDTRISKSDDSVLLHGFRAMLEQPWLPVPLAELFFEAIGQLKTD